MRLFRQRGLVFFFLFLCGRTLLALGPHEVLLLVNASSPRSMEVANHYIRERQIPARNVIYLELPYGEKDTPIEIRPADFTRHIWDPARAELQQRGLDRHVLAWVYSIDFPIRISGPVSVSIQGLTFVRNQLPDAELIRKGQYASILYAGPDPGGPAGAPSRSFDRYAAHYGGQMPLPSMMLGFCGPHGLTVEETVAQLRRAGQADGKRPQGSVYFWTSADIRSTCREWQYLPVVSELKNLSVSALVSTSPPPPELPLMGMMAGTVWVAPSYMKNLQPGSVGEHLTSMAAMYDRKEQGKATDWLRAGAAASSGAVTEPYALWPKFAHARFFVHYAFGCTILESYYQAIRSPMQILLVGDPLAAPWAFLMELDVREKGERAGDAEEITFLFDVRKVPSLLSPEFHCFVDGKFVGRVNKREWALNVQSLSDGYHELRVVAVLPGPIGFQAHDTIGFTLDRRGRGVEVEGPGEFSLNTSSQAVDIALKVRGYPIRTALICNERLIAVSKADMTGELSFNPALAGAGPVCIQAQAEYEDGEIVRSVPLNLNIGRTEDN